MIRRWKATGSLSNLLAKRKMGLPTVKGVIAGTEEADIAEEGTINCIIAILPQVHHLLLHPLQVALGLLLLILDLPQRAKMRRKARAKAKDDDN